MRTLPWVSGPVIQQEASLIWKSLAEGSMRSQFLHVTRSPAVALYYAEAFGNGSKHLVVRIDLSDFKGCVTDVSNAFGCNENRVRSDTKVYNFATQHQVVMLTGYVHHSMIVDQFETTDLRPCSFDAKSFGDFRSALTPDTLNTLSKWGDISETIKRREDGSPVDVLEDDAAHGEYRGLAKRNLNTKLRNFGQSWEQ